ncbi:phage tail tape measure protein [Laribacter hongkongensis]|uniref:phage tail tape measure protein n=1 Tax=Laribacter hongkongensis TaxID=168471 RepID=UPI001EFE633F|nr:phage tail tape measure protein [Laribacter hongkongensis]MCG9046584.1 phage tail tape measure protein [Laribacter hongkongensis]
MTDEIAKGVVAVEVDATGVEAGINRAVRSIDTLGANASRSGDQAAAGIQKIGTGGDAAARRVEMSTKSIVAQIQRVTAEMESGGRNTRQYFEALASQRGLDANALKPYLEQLDKVSASHVRTGLSAKEMSFALRGVPAQFTDIAVSLASGQQPLTVLLQQGGQLKDMFGGIGPAAKALGGYMVGLINPLTLTAGAVAAVSYAYYKGSEEQDAYIKSLVNTNHAIGLSVGQLSDMANRMDEVGGTTAFAAENLAKFVSAGVTNTDGLQKYATVAGDAYKYLGKSVDDTAKAFAALEKDPLKAAVKIDEAERFLTASVYDQIKALEEQGRKTEAAKVAQDAFSDATAEKSAEMQKSLGIIERSWNGITDKIKEAGDALMEIGRPLTIAEQLASKRLALSRAKNYGSLAERSGTVSALQNDINLLEAKQAREAMEAGWAARKEADRNRAISLRKDIDAWEKSNQTRQQQLQKEVELHRKALNEKLINEDEYRRRVAISNDKYKETAKKPKAYQDDEATKMLLGLSEKAASLRAQLAMPGDLTESAKKLVEFNQRLDELRKKSGLTADQKSVLSRDGEIRESMKVVAQLEEELKKKTALAKLNDETQRIADQLASQRDANHRGYERELDAVGRGDKYLAELQKITAIEDKIEEIKRNFRESEGFQFMTEEQKRLQLDRFNALGEEMVEDFRRHAASLDIANMDWTNGATKALENYTDAARNASDSTRDLFTNAFQGMEDSISEFVRTGKLSFADLTDSIIRDLIRMQVKASITGPLAGIIGNLFGGSLGAGNLVDNGQLLGSMFATGGHVVGPGSGTSDSIPAWLSNGEYVIKADTVSKYGKGFFDRLNAGHFATGGLVGSSKAATSAPAQPVAVSVEVVNQTSQPVSAQAGPVKFDGEKYVQQVILSDIRRGGPISRALGSRT